MTTFGNRIAARIQTLQAQQVDITTRARRDVADAQKEIDLLTHAASLLTPDAEAVLGQLIDMGIVLKE